jgi:hypothetical protein
LTALALAEIAAEVGLPPGVLNVITGPGSRVGRMIVEHPGIDKIAFTGDTSTGREIMRDPPNAQAHHPRARRQVAEHRLPRRRSRRCRARRDDRDFLRQGRSLRRRLTPARRQVDQERVHRQGRRPREEDGAGRSARSEDALGAISSKKQLENDLRYIDIAKNEGASLVAGGGRADIGTGKGLFPAADGVRRRHPEMTIAREEIFGPVLAAIEFADLDEAIAAPISLLWPGGRGVDQGHQEGAPCRQETAGRHGVDQHLQYLRHRRALSVATSRAASDAR